MNSTTTSQLLKVATLALLLTINSPVLAAETPKTDTISNPLQGDWGQINVNLRYRFEHVNQDGLKTANGDPGRLRLGYLSPKYTGFQTYAEVLGNTPIFLDDFDDSSNGKTDYAVIRDPNEVALNQLWLTYETIPDTTIKGGRQRVAWDNERFICDSKWRQMGQTFDSITLMNKSLGNLSVKAGYLWTALTTENEEVGMQSPLLNLNYSFPDIGSLVAYGYWLDYDDPDDSGSFEYAYSSQTYGLRFNGSPTIAEGLKLLYTAEYAGQSGYQENPKDFSAEYYSIIGGLLVPGEGSLFTNFKATMAYEVLSSDNGVPFQTPLGANHRYNGWADLFGKSKPAAGLRDLYGSLSTTVAGVKVDLQYHDFQADAGDSDYGTEFDIKLTRKFMKNYEVLVSYATYNANEYKSDTEKFWLQLTMIF